MKFLNNTLKISALHFGIILRIIFLKVAQKVEKLCLSIDRLGVVYCWKSSLKWVPIAVGIVVRITSYWTSNMTRYEFFNCVINPLTIFKQIAFNIGAIILAQVE